MKIVITNPLQYRIGGGLCIGYTLKESHYNKEQIVDLVRRILLEKSICSDKIEVIEK